MTNTDAMKDDIRAIADSLAKIGWVAADGMLGTAYTKGNATLTLGYRREDPSVPDEVGCDDKGGYVRMGGKYYRYDVVDDVWKVAP